LFLGLDGQPLVHASLEARGQFGIELIAGINQQFCMDVPPECLQPRVHAGKRILHAGSDSIGKADLHAQEIYAALPALAEFANV
jgi:hypothetical protein